MILKLFIPLHGVDGKGTFRYVQSMKEYKINKKLGKRIRKLRKEQKISQEGLAEKAKIHRTYMGKIERGESNPPIHTVGKIANALKVSLSKLFD